MTRTAAIALVFWFAVTPAARAADEDETLKEKLATPVVLDKGIDPNTPLKDALEFFSDRYDLTILIDQAAFQKKKVEKVLDHPVWLPKLRGVRLELLLHLTASQFDGTVEVRMGAVWIVPQAKPIPLADLMKPADPKLKEMLAKKVSFENGIDAGTPLRDALEFIDSQLGQKFLIDFRAFERAKVEKIEEKLVQLGPTKDVVYGTMLEQLLKPAGATFVLREDMIVVVPLEKK